MPTPGQQKRGQVWYAAPRGDNIKNESGVKGVWLYPGEYVIWNYAIDRADGRRFVVGYTILSHGVSSGLGNY